MVPRDLSSPVVPRLPPPLGHMSPRNLAALQSCLPSTEASGTWSCSINIQGMRVTAGRAPPCGRPGGRGLVHLSSGPHTALTPLTPASAWGSHAAPPKVQNHTRPQRDMPRLQGEGLPRPCPRHTDREGGQQDELTLTPVPGPLCARNSQLPHQQPVDRPRTQSKPQLLGNS